MALAARGSRNLDAGVETVEDEAQATQLRRQARRVYVESTVAAGILTGLGLLTPE